MKGVIVHGVLLVLALTFGYQTWTREKTAKPTTGEVSLWDRNVSDLVAVEYENDKRTVRIERRGTGDAAYLWGIDTRVEKHLKPKPPTPPAEDKKPDDKKADDKKADDKKADDKKADDKTAKAKADDKAAEADDKAKPDDKTPDDKDKVASTAVDAGAPPAPPEPEYETTTTKREFPVGDAGEAIIKNMASMHVVRALGTLTDEQKKEFKLDSAVTTLAVIFKDGTKNFVIGDPVTGTAQRYALDPDSGKGFILAGTLISPLQSGESVLAPKQPNGFDQASLDSVELTANGKTKTASRIETTTEKGIKAKTWGDKATQKPDQTLANVIDNIGSLKASRYAPELAVKDMTRVVSVTYKDAKGKQLGTLGLYKIEKPGELPEDGSADPTKPPPPVIEYYVLTETTRVPAQVAKPLADRIEQDVPTLFSK